MRTARAFTLLEVMVVLAIIGGLLAVVSLSGSDRQAEDRTRRTAQQISALLMAYRQEAVFQNIDLGVALNETQMSLLQLVDVRTQEFSANKTQEEIDRLTKNPWQSYQGTLRQMLDIPPDIVIELRIDEREIDLTPPKDEDTGPAPVLLFLSSDEYTPFHFTLTHAADERFAVHLKGDGFGLPLLEVEYFEG